MGDFGSMSSKKVVQGDVASAKDSLAGLEARPAKRRRKGVSKSPKRASDLYKTTLGKWMWEEKAKCGGSWDALTERILQAWPGQRLTGPTVIKWGDGTYAEELKRDRIELLARYKKTTPEALQAWLETGVESAGENAPSSDGSNEEVHPSSKAGILVKELAEASYQELLNALEIILVRLRSFAGEQAKENKIMQQGDRAVSHLIQVLMVEQGLDRQGFADLIHLDRAILDLALDSYEPLPAKSLQRLAHALSRVAPFTVSLDLLKRMNQEVQSREAAGNPELER